MFQIAKETEAVEKHVNESSSSLAMLKEDLGQVEIDYLQIDKNIQKADQLVKDAKVNFFYILSPVINIGTVGLGHRAPKSFFLRREIVENIQIIYR